MIPPPATEAIRRMRTPVVSSKAAGESVVARPVSPSSEVSQRARAAGAESATAASTMTASFHPSLMPAQGTVTNVSMPPGKVGPFVTFSCRL